MKQPNPLIYKCNKCNWKKIVYPKSDSLISGIDIYSHCPKCGSKKLTVNKPTILDIIISKLS